MPRETPRSIVEVLNHTSSHALALNVVATVGAASLMNGLIFTLGWNATVDPAREPFFAPPGFIIGLVWMLLFALMAAARWNLNCAAISHALADNALSARARLTTLVLSCLSWPLYSLAIGSVVGGLIGCLASLALAVSAVARAWSVSRSSAALVVPVVVWLIFATAILVAELLAA